MKNKVGLVIIIVVAVAVFLGIYHLYTSLSSEFAPTNIALNDNKQESGNNLSENTEDTKKVYSADNFVVVDANGNKVELWDCIGKPLIVNFWASWCGPCKSEMPHFEKAYAENPDVAFMMINIDEIKTNGEKYVESQGFTFPVYYDTTGEAAEKYGIMYIPMTFLIDKNGELVGHVDGSMSKEDLDKCISLVKGEEELIIQ